MICNSLAIASHIWPISLLWSNRVSLFRFHKPNISVGWEFLCAIVPPTWPRNSRVLDKYRIRSELEAGFWHLRSYIRDTEIDPRIVPADRFPCQIRYWPAWKKKKKKTIMKRRDCANEVASIYPLPLPSPIPTSQTVSDDAGTIIIQSLYRLGERPRINYTPNYIGVICVLMIGFLCQS